MNSSLPYMVFVWSLILLCGCKKQISQEELIQAAVEIKLQQWEDSQLELCREEALLLAERYVDSLLLVTSLETKLDTIPKPAKPVRPPKPVFRKKPDSVIVKPIYKDN